MPAANEPCVEAPAGGVAVFVGAGEVPDVGVDVAVSGGAGWKADEIATAEELVAVVPLRAVQVLEFLAVAVRAVVWAGAEGRLEMASKLAKGRKNAHRVVLGRVVTLCCGQYIFAVREGVVFLPSTETMPIFAASIKAAAHARERWRAGSPPRGAKRLNNF